MNINGLIHINKSSLTAYIKDYSAPINIALGKDTIENLEKVNTEFLEQKLKESLAKIDLRKLNFLMILSDDLSFTKTFPKPKNETEAASIGPKIQAFLEEVPFELKDIKEKSPEIANSIISTVTNINLYTTLVMSMEAVGMQVGFVVPQAFLDPYMGLKKIDVSLIDFVNKNLSLIKEMDLLEDIGKSNSSLIKYLIILGLALIVFTGAWVAYDYIKSTKIGGKPVQVEQVAPQETKQTEIKEIQKATKEEITVQILNGTGTVGLASKLKDGITQFGYKKIDIGNSESPKENDTVISSSKDISEEYKNEMKVYLEKTFISVKTVNESSESVTKSIKVVTGGLLTK